MPHEAGMMNGSDMGDMEDMSPMEMLGKAIDLLQNQIDDPKSAGEDSQQKLLYLLQSIQEMMPKMMKGDMKSPMPESPSAKYMSGAEEEASNPYSGGNRKYSYAQYRPGK